MNRNDIIAQSKTAYEQWKEQWRKQATHHSKYAPHKSLSDFENYGIGRACLLVANGYSLEKNIETIRENQDNVDIFCCDKTLGVLIDHGITPDFCLVADANVNYKKYMEPWKDKLQDTILFSCITANPEWTDNGNWKDKYFFVNKDSINSQEEFSALGKCNNLIPAGTNVSNAMLLMLTQCDNGAPRNFFGYDVYGLIGFDYSWQWDGNYYAFDKLGNGKYNYMRHIYPINRGGKQVYSSQNLIFSAQWLEKYLSIFRLPVVLCSDDSVLQKCNVVPIENVLKYSYKVDDKDRIKDLVGLLKQYQLKLDKVVRDIQAIGEDHALSYQRSI